MDSLRQDTESPGRRQTVKTATLASLPELRKSESSRRSNSKRMDFVLMTAIS